MNFESLPRRAFLQGGILCLSGLTGSLPAAITESKPAFRIGLVTDLHYGDKPPAGTRYYRETLHKLEEAVEHFNAGSPAFVVELGDLIDKATTVEEEMTWLDTIEKVFARTKARRHYVLGNHCVATLTKLEFAAHTGGARASHYSFDEGQFHFIILDACFTSTGEPYQRGNFDWKDANIPADQLEWLRTDLAGTNKQVIIFAHQRLDDHGPHSVRNAPAVRTILEQSGKVLAVFQGHSHANDYQQVKGIHYCTLVAMVEGSGVESSGYAMLDVMSDGALRLHGYRHQVDRAWPGAGRRD